MATFRGSVVLTDRNAKKAMPIPPKMYTHLIATTVDKTDYEYDLAIRHRSPVDPGTKVWKIRFLAIPVSR